MQSEVEKLEQAISAIQGLTGQKSGASLNGTRPERTMSAAARRRIAQAQRARWAKLRNQSKRSTTKKSGSVRSLKRKLSPEGRRRIVAAAKARWARVRGQKEKKAA